MSDYVVIDVLAPQPVAVIEVNLGTPGAAGPPGSPVGGIAGTHRRLSQFGPTGETLEDSNQYDDGFGNLYGPGYHVITRQGIESGIIYFQKWRYDAVGTADYLVGRNAADGILDFQGTQDAYKGYRFDGPVRSSGTIVSSGGGVGYTTGAGGTVEQATSKSTGVALNKLCGTITINAAELASSATVSFTLTNSYIASGDLVLVQHDSAGTLGAYTFAVTPGAGSASIAVRNVHTAALSEAIVIRFAIIKAVTA